MASTKSVIKKGDKKFFTPIADIDPAHAGAAKDPFGARINAKEFPSGAAAREAIKKHALVGVTVEPAADSEHLLPKKELARRAKALTTPAAKTGQPKPAKVTEGPAAPAAKAVAAGAKKKAAKPAAKAAAKAAD